MIATNLCLPVRLPQACIALTFLVLIHLSWPVFTMAAGASEPEWDRMTFGLNATVWNPAWRCPDIPPLLMVQIDPERFRFSIYQFHDAGLPAPLTIQDWQRHTGAYVLFNAGLFREDYSYLGLLLKEGRPLGTKRHHSWQGVFAAEPKEPTQRKARVWTSRLMLCRIICSPIGRPPSRSCCSTGPVSHGYAKPANERTKRLWRKTVEEASS